MDVTTTTDQNNEQDLSETAWQARMMALPCVLWSDNIYRIVLVYDEDDDEIRRIPERVAGCDSMGHQRWEMLGMRTWDTLRESWVVPDDWSALAHSLAVTAAPWPKQQTEEQSPPAWLPVHQAVVDALIDAAVDVVRTRVRNVNSELGQMALQVHLAALDKVARAAGIANLEERATEALRRAQHEPRDESTT